MGKERKPVAWCRACEFIVYEGARNEVEQLEASDWECVQCGDKLTPVAQLSPGERVQVRATVWFRNLRALGLHGVSPGGAASKLGCHRTMIDKLAEMGVLEKSVYDRDGIHMVFISERSIARAKESKRKTGKWTKFKPTDETEKSNHD